MDFIAAECRERWRPKKSRARGFGAGYSASSKTHQAENVATARISFPAQRLYSPVLGRLVNRGLTGPLFYRLNVFPIVVPSLRERKGDIPLLVQHFIKKSHSRLGKKITIVPKPLMDALIRYDWPGNVRELANVIERAVILASGPVLTLDEPLGRVAPTPEACESGEMLEAIERAHIVRVLNECGWKIKGKVNAAVRLGINPSTLRSRIQKLGIVRPARELFRSAS